jgi:hypothetical protein
MLGLFGSAVCTPCASFAQPSADGRQVIPDRQIEDVSAAEQGRARRLANSKEVEQQAVRQQNHARSVAIAAANQQAIGTTTAITNPEAVKQEEQRQKVLNQSAVKATTPAAIDEIRASLPKFAQIGGQLKYGEHIVVSKEGQEIVSLIRSLTNKPQTDIGSTLRRIQEFASQGKPEALHFLGFAYEFGIFGVPKQIGKAISYYQSAAARNYQPSFYNLALIAAYGRGGTIDSDQALRYVTRAQGLANDTSGRVCGMASFLSFRAGKYEDAFRLSRGCTSPLAHLARATSGDTETLSQRVVWLRDSIATGVDDGYAQIAKISRPLAKNDNNYTFCKYALVNRHHKTQDFKRLREEATQCVDQMPKNTDNGQGPLSLREQVIAGVTSFVPTEIATLSNMRKSNRFHFGWSVPYLPFAQSEMDLFEPLLLKATQQ